MAEEENGQEKTEEATPKRLEKAREEGQVARSRELGTTLLLMTGSISMLLFGEMLAGRLKGLMRGNFGFDQVVAQDPAYMFSYLGQSVFELLDVVILILFLIMLAGALGSIALGGWLFSVKPMMPKLNRLNPLSGLQRMFSLKALIELFKAIAKFVVVAAVASLILWQMKDELIALGQESIEVAIVHAAQVIAWSALGMSAATILIAFVDVPFQVFDHAKKLRMTRQQLKDEFKDSEGKPEVKSRVRQLQREMAYSRMMAAVPEADVVITNPEHFSVALRYDMQGVRAPVVVASGADEIAIKIREIANQHQVPLIRAPQLTRAIYFTTEIDEQIPSELYLAVAQVLAFVYQLSELQLRRPLSQSQIERLNRKLSVPDAMLFDADGQLM